MNFAVKSQERDPTIVKIDWHCARLTMLKDRRAKKKDRCRANE